MALFLLTQRLDETPHQFITATEAAAFVNAGLARWHSGSKVVKLTTLQKPRPQLHDLSCSMPGSLTERVVQGSARDFEILKEWRSQAPRGPTMSRRDGQQLEHLLDPEQAAKVLGYCSRTVQRKAAAGELPHVRIGGRIRFLPSKLQQFIAEREVANK